MPDILITSIRTYPSMLEVRGRSPSDCSSSALEVSVTVFGQSQPSYRGSATVTSPVSGGYRSWICYAPITPEYAAAPNKVDPPCDLRVLVSATQGSCATKPGDPVHVSCCALIDWGSSSVSADCDDDRMRTVTVQYTIVRRNASGEISAQVKLSSAEDSEEAVEAATLAIDDESLSVTANFTVASPPPNQTRTYECVVELVTAGKCADDTRLNRTIEVPGCPCPAAPAGNLTLTEVSAPYAGVAETTRNGVSCVEREQVRVVAPGYAADSALDWTNATPVAGQRAATVNLPADGAEVAVVARLGTDPCFHTLTKVLRRCVERPCPRITGVLIDATCLEDGRNSVTFTAITDPPDAAGTYRWNFGDGGPAEESSTPSKNHIYSSATTRMVTVTLVPADPECPSTSFNRAVSLAPCPQPACPRVTDIALSSQTCVANSDGSTTGAALAIFTATTDPANPAGSYAWQFGDGSVVTTTQVPTANHAYATGGTRTVKVTFTPQNTRCPATSAEKPFTISNCAVSTGGGGGGGPAPAIDQCCIFTMVIMFMVLAAGFVLLPIGLCALFSGAIPVGVIVTGLGALFMLVALVLFLLWLLWCATVRGNCLLVDVVLGLLGLLGTVLAAATVIVAIVNVVLVLLIEYYGVSAAGLPCGIGVLAGIMIDWVEFWFIYAVVYWFAVAAGCQPWPRWFPPAWRPSLPNWLNAFLGWLRARVPRCPF